MIWYDPSRFLLLETSATALCGKYVISCIMSYHFVSFVTRGNWAYITNSLQYFTYVTYHSHSFTIILSRISAYQHDHGCYNWPCLSSGNVVFPTLPGQSMSWRVPYLLAERLFVAEPGCQESTRMIGVSTMLVLPNISLAATAWDRHPSALGIGLAGHVLKTRNLGLFSWKKVAQNPGDPSISTGFWCLVFNIAFWCARPGRSFWPKSVLATAVIILFNGPGSINTWLAGCSNFLAWTGFPQD